MFRDVIDGLTPEQKRALRASGISAQLLGDWRHGRRLPTEVQVVKLAAAAGCDRRALQDDVTLQRAAPEERAWLLRAMGKTTETLTGFVLGVLVLLGAVFAPPAHAHGMANDANV